MITTSLAVASHFAAATLCAALCQDPGPGAAPVPPPRTEETVALEKFSALRSTQKAIILARVRGRLAKVDNAAYRRISALRLDVSSCPEETVPPAHDPLAYPSIAQWPARTPADPDSAMFERVRANAKRAPFLPDLQRRVQYDWRTQQIVALDVPPTYEQAFGNLLHGWAPDSDAAVARVLQILDADAEMRAAANWFSHTHADLAGNSYPGVTLYDLWYTGKTVAVPDVDAVIFERRVLGTSRLRSPLSGPSRDALYEEIQKQALEYRKYRTLREAAAAAYVRAEPRMEEIYGRLVPRFHYLYAKHGESLESVRDYLVNHTRDTFIEIVDAAVSPAGGEFHMRESRRGALEEMQAMIRTIAFEELGRFVSLEGR